jgi:hypothetical protein
VGLILSGIPSRAVAIIGIFADGVNFWFLAELNHGRLRDAVSQTPAINPTLTIPAVFRMPRALSFGDVGWSTLRRLPCRQTYARAVKVAVGRS